MTRAAMIGLAALIALALFGTTPSFAQAGYDRPGGDYSSAPVPTGDPAICASRCEHEKNCRAWSFSYPSNSGGPAMCWLKREVVPAKESSCCVSGVRGAGGLGSRAVLEVRSREVPFVLEHGQIVGRLVYEKMLARPDRLYGSGIGSNYQAQGLKLSKHFR